LWGLLPAPAVIWVPDATFHRFEMWGFAARASRKKGAITIEIVEGPDRQIANALQHAGGNIC